MTHDSSKKDILDIYVLYNYIVTMDVTFTADGLLPPGDLEMTFAQLRDSVLVYGPGDAAPNWDGAWRAKLVDNLEVMVEQLWQVGINEIFVDGSFAEDKDHPNDIDGYFVVDLKQFASGKMTRAPQPARSAQDLDLGSRRAPTLPRLPQDAVAHVAPVPRRAVPALGAGERHCGPVWQRAGVSLGISPVAPRWQAPRHRQNQEVVMIRNENEYQEAVRRLGDERARLVEHEARLLKAGLAADEVKRALEPLQSFGLQLSEEIASYERLKRGDLGEMENLHGLGRTLVAARIALGLSQRELAERLGVHESQVSRDERNEYHGITVDRVSRILDAMGVAMVSAFKPVANSSRIFAANPADPQQGSAKAAR